MFVMASGNRFTRVFWTSASVELLERMAYYAVFIVLTLYLSNVYGFSDIEAGIVSGIFSATLSLLPTFSGALADRIGFRSSLLLAFALLSVGYLGLAVLPTLFQSAGMVDYGLITTFTGLRESPLRWTVIPVLLIIVVGGSFIKAVISGTIARETTTTNRARGFSIFYMMVNIGSFTGKTVVEPLRRGMGSEGLVVLNYFSAAMTLLAFILVWMLYRSRQEQGDVKNIREIGSSLLRVLTNGRIIAITLITSGFWMIYMQLYATMPKYVLRMAGDTATPAWYANLNPLVVVLCVNLVTRLMQRYKAVTSMGVGMWLMPFSALLMAAGNLVGSDDILGLHPVAFMMLCGIGVQALAETFISPRYLEYFSLQAPKGDEGLYLGFSHINSCIASFIGFGLSGFLLSKYCPDPQLYATHEAWQAASVHAHYIWYVFAVIGALAAVALFIFGKLTKDDK